MRPKIEQEEMEALLEMFQRERGASRSAETASAKSYDLCNPLRFKNNELSRVRDCFDRVSERFFEGLAELLDLEIEGEIVEVKQVARREFEAGRPDRSYSKEILGSQSRNAGYGVIDPVFLGASVERLMGGRGDSLEGFEITPVARRVGDHILSRLLEGLNDHFRPAVSLECRLPNEEDKAGLEEAPRLPGDPFLRAVFGVREERWSGEVWVLLPADALEGVFDDGVEAKSSGEAGAGSEEAKAVQTANLETMRQTSVELSVRYGPGEITGSELLNMKEGDVILLGQAVGSPVEIAVEGCPRFLGGLGKSRRQVVVQVLKELAD